MVVAGLFHFVVVLLVLQDTSGKTRARDGDQQCMGSSHSRHSPETKMAAKSFVDKAIRDNKVVCGRGLPCVIQRMPDV